ncbi:MAG: SAM-dependent chlorinase/fluorinase [Leptospirales bacterium]|nr:SAM-dependent chlorinase/fluorinase [Leptospirales bacterium]
MRPLAVLVGPIVLLTDFSTRDWFVGVMRGVLAERAPQTAVLDLCHDVRRGDVREGAFMLRASVQYYPAGTVFCCVVDPGVGSNRRALAARCNGRFFVAPDNGLLTHILNDSADVHSVENPDWLSSKPSATFHGRDIFAPVAARLAGGAPLKECGPRLDDWARLDWPAVAWRREGAHGAIIYVDRFGNLITNIDCEEFGAKFPRAADSALLLRAGSAVIQGCVLGYSSQRPGELLFYRGSAGLFEIAVNLGDAAQMLQLRAGDPVEIRIPE